MEKVTVKVTHKYYDKVLEEYVESGKTQEVPTERADTLVYNKVVEIVETKEAKAKAVKTNKTK